MAILNNTTVNDTGYLLPGTGSISQRPGYAYQYFTATGSATFSVPTGVSAVDVLIVAGGGGAGVSNGSAGGGAGGMVEVTGFPVTPGGSVPVSVGTGGAGVNTTGPGQPRGANGQNSTFGSLTAIGGGGAGSEVGNNSGSAGGSGGGGVRGGGTGGAAQQPGQPGQSGTFGYGFAGGQSSAASPVGDGPPHYGGGGGGGAGQAGIRGNTASGTDPVSGKPWGSGGDGRLSAITGTYFAGGGGGGYYNNNAGADYPNAGKGGLGGGGNGGFTTWRDGAVNTGGGGGSSGLLDVRGNGDGGPGIIVVRWTNPNNPVTTATIGMTRYNTDGNYLEVYNGSRWVSAQKTVVAFNQPGGYNWRVPNGITAVEVLVVAGGGGGGAGYQGGGGGAGGLIYQATYGVAPETYIPVHVGAGGIGSGARGERLGTITTFAGENGQPSKFGELEAIGGGRGAGELQAFSSGSPHRATDGGSGGGGSHYQDNTPSPVESFTTGTAGQGNAGGNGYTGSPYGGGGGGGAGSAGLPASPATPTRCQGGAGLAYSITGTSQVYAGGGSGSVRGEGLFPAHPDGGGGGAGFGQGCGIPGQAGTGGGGGSGGNGPGAESNGGLGGPGIVIIRY